MDIAALFAKDRNWAAENLPKMRQYPVPDALPVTDGEAQILQRWTIWSDWEAVLDECKRRVLTAPNDFASRFVAVSWAYGIWDSEPEEDDPAWVDLISDVDTGGGMQGPFSRLEDLVLLGNLDKPIDLREIAWELVCRCAIQDWDLARGLLRNYSAKANHPERTRRALKGQLDFLIAVSHSGFVSALTWWRPELDEALQISPHIRDGTGSEAARVVAALRPWGMFFWGIGSTTAPVDDSALLSDAAHELEQADKIQRLGIQYRAVIGGIALRDGRLPDAASRFREIEREEPWNEFDAGSQPFIVLGLARSLEAANDGPAAIGLLEPLVSRTHDKQQYLLLAKLYVKSLGDYRKALTAIEAAVDEDPALEGDATVSVALALGRVGLDTLQAATAARTFGAPSRTVAAVKGALAATIRGFGALWEGTQQQLLSAVLALYWIDEQSPIPSLRYQMAVLSAAKAVEGELIHRLLAPFAAERRSGTSADAGDPISAFLRERRQPGLGQMLQALTRPKGSVSREWQAWVRKRSRTLLEHAQRNDTSSLTRWRNAVSHSTAGGEPGQSEAEAAFAVSKALLESISG